MSKVVFLEDAVEGMILSDPIINNMGQTLLPPGIVLAPQHLRILKTWNIKLIHIKESETEEENEISPELLKLAEEILAERMNWTPSIDIEKDWIKASLQLLAMKLQKKGNSYDQS